MNENLAGLAPLYLEGRDSAPSKTVLSGPENSAAIASTSRRELAKRGKSSPGDSASPMANRLARGGLLAGREFNSNPSDGATTIVTSSIQYFDGSSGAGSVPKFRECSAPSGTMTRRAPGGVNRRMGSSKILDNSAPAGFCDLTVSLRPSTAARYFSTRAAIVFSGGSGSIAVFAGVITQT